MYYHGGASHAQLTISLWLFVIHSAFALLGGANPVGTGAATPVGVALYAFGSYLNTGSEYGRDTWKRRAENSGCLYTEGLFRFSRHINYLGDLILFSGFAMITGRAWSFLIPLLMLGGFVFINIPTLDGYLARKYGADFDRYAARTRKLIPWIY